jgi:hypothetical protein
VEGGCYDLEVGDLQSPVCGKELFANREDRLFRMGASLPAGIHLALRPIPLLVRALLMG